MTIPRPVLAAVAAVAVLAGGAYAVDAVSASRLEADISARIASDAAVAGPPSVMIGGPLNRWSEPDVLSSVAIRAEGVERPGLGPVAVEAQATDVRIPADAGGDGDGGSDAAGADALVAESVVVVVQITGDSLAPALRMQDVVVGAADDPSLAGGVENRAQISGTLTESGERVSAFVDLVVDASGAHLVPVAAATGPGGIPDQDVDLALRATALTLEPDVLPLGVPVSTLTVKHGTISAVGTGGPGTPPLDGVARRDL
ncbi:MAG: LmeA family phospholipid-binding protein [Cellulosimicrobium funkei]